MPKISSLPTANAPTSSDVLAGVQNGVTKKFSLAIIADFLQNLFVPKSNIGVANGVASLDSTGKVPGTQLDLSDKQPTITASGILKGDGQGGVSAAVAGTDYQAPLTIDATPTANSTNPVQSGGVYADVRTRVPVYGMGKNLLDNAYFVGGGSQLGDGIFPINQRGQTSYSGNVATIDRWFCYTGLDIHADGIDFSQVMPAQYAPSLSQQIEKSRLIAGYAYCLSALWTDGTFWTNSGTLQNSIGWQIESGTVNNNGCAIRARNANVWQVAVWNTDTSRRLVAVKLELGTEQTLAHQESSAWVLNEIPDYETEWEKCNKYLRVYYRDSTLAKGRMLGVRFSHESRAGYALFAVPIDPPMASTPTVTNNNALAIRTITSSSNVANVTYSFSNAIRNTLNIRADSDNITAGTLYWVDTLNAGNKIILTAEP